MRAQVGDGAKALLNGSGHSLENTFDLKTFLEKLDLQEKWVNPSHPGSYLTVPSRDLLPSLSSEKWTGIA